jgi:hypothetical protein
MPNTLFPLDHMIRPIRVMCDCNDEFEVSVSSEMCTIAQHLMSTSPSFSANPSFGLLKRLATKASSWYGLNTDAYDLIVESLGIAEEIVDESTHPGVYALLTLARYEPNGMIKWPFYYRVGSSVQCDWIDNTPANIKKCYQKITQDNLNKYYCTAAYCVPTIQSRSLALWLLAPLLDLKFEVYTSEPSMNDEFAHSTMSYQVASRCADNEGARLSLHVCHGRYCFIMEADNTVIPFRKFRSILNYSADVPSLTGISERRTEKDNKDTPLYGVELELTTNSSIFDVVSAFGEVFGVCKADSSIRGSKRNKAELVTVPATLRYHRKMWTQWFKQDMTQYDQSLDTNNGMHIHIGRKAFYLNDELNHNHLLRFSYFFNNIANRWFIVKCSERSDYEIQGYCNFAPIAYEKTKGKQITRAVKSAATSKMYAVNHTKNHTIEVRIFKGVVSFASVMKNLELVDAVLNYTRDCSFRQCNVYGLMNWLEKRTSPSQYRALKMYLKRNISMDDARVVTDFLENVVTLDGRRKYDNLTDLQRSYIAVSMPQEAHKLGDYEVYFRDAVSPCLSLDAILMARKEG